MTMKRFMGFLLTAILVLSAGAASAGPYSDTIDLFKNAGASAAFFKDCYGYAVFPSVGQGAFVVGAAHGKGRVYQADKYVGNTSVTQVSVGLQAGGRAYSMIIFFQDKRAFDEFTNGNYEFGADVNATAITAGASGQVGTTGANSGASGGKNDATTSGNYYKGMAVFTIVKGGAMVQAAVAGQKFTYSPRAAN
jgi:lipid-binding SYLF domain-containing protein